MYCRETFVVVWSETTKSVIVLPIINYPLYGTILNYSLFKFFNDAFMNAITEIFNGILSIGQHHRGSVVWQLTFWLCVTTVDIQ